MYEPVIPKPFSRCLDTEMSIVPSTKMMLIPSSAPGHENNEAGPFNNRDVPKIHGTKEIIVNTDLEQSM